jgi:beta-phosphoglucomutase-like phosphatase (HAD superfamily)
MLNYKNTKAFIFDLDGVLADTEPLRYLTYRQIFKETFQVDLPKKMPIDLIGQTEQKNFQHFLDMFLLSGDIDKLKQRRIPLLLKVIQDHVTATSCLYTLLDKLSVAGIQTSLATNSGRTYTQQILKKLKLEEQFFTVATGEDVENPKPAADIYIKVADTMDISPSQCVVVEDSPKGIHAAKMAGMTCIAITTSLPKIKLLEADLIIDSLEQIGV